MASIVVVSFAQWRQGLRRRPISRYADLGEAVGSFDGAGGPREDVSVDQRQRVDPSATSTTRQRQRVDPPVTTCQTIEPAAILKSAEMTHSEIKHITNCICRFSLISLPQTNKLHLLPSSSLPQTNKLHLPPSSTLPQTNKPHLPPSSSLP